MAGKTTFVLIHGAWGGGWKFARVAERFLGTQPSKLEAVELGAIAAAGQHRER